MGLNVTVSKGHDFTTGNVTRAALNAGATPTIAVTGSVGESEIASGAITNAKVKTNADIDVAKLALASGKIIIGATNGNASALSGTSSFSSVASETEGNAGLLVDVGDKFEVLKTNTLAVSSENTTAGKQYLNGDSALSIHKVTTDGVTTNNLRIKHITNSIHGNHISTANALDGASIGKNSAGKLAILDNGVHWDKLYNHKNSAGNLRSAFLSYGSGGDPKPTEVTASGQILVSGGTSADMVLNSFFKEIDVLNPPVANAGFKRVAHGLTNPAGSAGVIPKFVSLMLVCVNESQKSTDETHGYSQGDVILIPHEWSATATDDQNAVFSIACDNTYIIVHHGAITSNSPQYPCKYGGATAAESGTASADFELGSCLTDFKIVVSVCG